MYGNRSVFCTKKTNKYEDLQDVRTYQRNVIKAIHTSELFKLKSILAMVV